MLTRNGLVIPVVDFSDQDVERLTVEPSRKFQSFGNTNTRFVLYSVHPTNKSNVIIPPLFKKNVSSKISPDFYSSEKMSDDKVFIGKLNDFQENAQQIILDKLEIRRKESGIGNGIIELPCGFGKTVLAISLAMKMKYSTLIIVHKDDLLNQWIERIVQFTNFKKSEIGIIRGNEIDTKSSIVIGMLQSISMKDYPPQTFDRFNMVIVDEAHHIGAQVFSKSLTKICAPYMIGLSATPERSDGLSFVFRCYLGETIFAHRREVDSSVRLVRVFFESEDEKYLKTKKIYNRVTKKTTINNSALITTLTECEERNQSIVDAIIPYINSERYILVLTDRVDHIFELIRLLTPYCERNGVEVGPYYGKMKRDDLDRSMKMHINVATYSMCAEGYDNAKLNCLVIATPKSDVVQICGRIFRKKHSIDLPATIIDIVDTKHESLMGQFYKRNRYYKANGYGDNTSHEPHGGDSSIDSNHNVVEYNPSERFKELIFT